MSNQPKVQMTFKEFGEIFSLIRREREYGDKYINSLPNDIATAFFDNAFVVSLDRVQDALIDRLFPKQMLSDVKYMLFECKYDAEKPAIGVVATDDTGKETGGQRNYIIASLDDMLQYFFHEYEFLD